MTNNGKVNSKNKKKKDKMRRAVKVLTILGVIYAVVIVLALSFVLGGSKCDKSVDTFCYDEIGIFEEYQINDINKKCKEIQRKNNLNVFVASCERIGFDAKMFGEDFCRKYNVDMSYSSFIIIINAYTDNFGNGKHIYDYYFDLYTFGSADRRITNKEIKTILYSSGGDLIKKSNNISAFIGTELLIEESVKAYSWILPNNSWTTIAIIALIIAIIVSIIVFVSVRVSYTRNRANETYSLKNNSKTGVIAKEDKFINSTVTFVTISSDSGGSGGSSHHGGSSFGGGGGGAGHRGGR